MRTHNSQFVLNGKQTALSKRRQNESKCLGQQLPFSLTCLFMPTGDWKDEWTESWGFGRVSGVWVDAIGGMRGRGWMVTAGPNPSLHPTAPCLAPPLSQMDMWFYLTTSQSFCTNAVIPVPSPQALGVNPDPSCPETLTHMHTNEIENRERHERWPACQRGEWRWQKDNTHHRYAHVKQVTLAWIISLPSA